MVEEIKRSTQGKLAQATQVASAQNLKPLFKQIRSRVSHLNSTLAGRSLADANQGHARRRPPQHV